jgi:hypothetical protein
MRFEVLTAVKMSIVGLLGCTTVWTCRLIPLFWKIILPPSSRHLDSVKIYSPSVVFNSPMVHGQVYFWSLVTYSSIVNLSRYMYAMLVVFVVADSDVGTGASSFSTYLSFESTTLANGSSSSSADKEQHSSVTPVGQSKQLRDSSSVCHTLDSFPYMFDSSSGMKVV